MISKKYKIIYPERGTYLRKTVDSPNAVHDIRDRLIGYGRRFVLFSDSDGVQEPDDFAYISYITYDRNNGGKKFIETSNGVLVPADKGVCPYGLTLVVMAEALRELGLELDPNILSAVGRNVRLTPGAKEFKGLLTQAGYRDYIAATCAYEHSVISFCPRIGITEWMCIEFDDNGELRRFTGGYGKTNVIRKWLKEKNLTEDDAFFLGDSWTDMNTLKDFRPGTVAFNPKYKELNGQAAVNVYSSDLRGVLPILDVNRILSDCEEAVPELVVFNNGIEKPPEIVDEELQTAKKMREKIDESVEAVLPRKEMLARIREDAGLSEGQVLADLSVIDVPRAIEKTIEKYSKFLQELKS